ncbi:imelysin family protein [Subsaximicrobium wynnwilliamsii]|uniref:Imelysin family protein n=1 Tax=Subsaximicrobium wynnwilliamsii TaxID=291179 RepID=A0A5C6ZI92_9FLAO|nr:imelysin family protein [Subsaximicrobium wynnwilliamsii]TXD84250.1 imelysin family protein [Subsaximicrobium wynnwilliamsii]TXD89871.1 imelysin family protein [Subsaximicrobium wynnwilliamsii]TXE03962.1 imelysin family protein [Subsaximicrobium wynnwilliamsii]
MIRKSLLAFFTLSLLLGCSSSDEGDSGSQNDGFDRQVMLSNWADNIIIPAYQDLNADLMDLSAQKEAFVNSPNQANLETLRASWLSAYKTWQYLEMFTSGKAEETNYVFQMNVYPTNVDDIEANIASGNYDLSNPNNNDAVGFPALDYLLFGLAETDAQILNAYTSNTKAEANKTYLSDVVNQMQSLTATVLNDWTGTYRDAFVNSTGNTATSATNKMTNDFIFYYEKGLRANKIGIPAGVFSAAPLSSKVEAFYNEEISKTLALEGLNAVQDFFNGKAYNSNATSGSFKAYLEYLNTINNGEDVSALINSQFNAARTKIESLDNNFVQQVETDNTQMTEAFDALQKVVVLLKIDMVQAMSIRLDYADSDGD